MKNLIKDIIGLLTEVAAVAVYCGIIAAAVLVMVR
jgi:hypothetical protein